MKRHFVWLFTAPLLFLMLSRSQSAIAQSSISSLEVKFTKQVIAHEYNGASYFLFIYNDEDKVRILRKNKWNNGEVFEFDIDDPLDRNDFKFYNDYLFIGSFTRRGLFYGAIDKFLSRADGEMLPFSAESEKTTGIYFLPNIHQFEIRGGVVYCSDGSMNSIYAYEPQNGQLKKTNRISSSAHTTIPYFITASEETGNDGWNNWISALQEFQNSIKPSGKNVIKAEDYEKFLAVSNLDEILGLQDKNSNGFIDTLRIRVRKENAKKNFEEYLNKAALFNFQGVNQFTPKPNNIIITRSINEYNRLIDSEKKARGALTEELKRVSIGKQEGNINRVLANSLGKLEIDKGYYLYNQLKNSYMEKQRGRWIDAVNNVVQRRILSSYPLYTSSINTYEGLKRKKDEYERTISRINEDINKIKPYYIHNTWNRNNNLKSDQEEIEGYRRLIVDYQGQANTQGAADKKNFFDSVYWEYSDNRQKIVSDTAMTEPFAAVMNALAKDFLDQVKRDYDANNTHLKSLYDAVPGEIEAMNKEGEFKGLIKFSSDGKKTADIDEVKIEEKLRGLLNAILGAENNIKDSPAESNIIKCVFKGIYDGIYQDILKGRTPYGDNEEYKPVLYFYETADGGRNRTGFSLTGMEAASRTIFQGDSSSYTDTINFDGLTSCRRRILAPGTPITPVAFSSGDRRILFRIMGQRIHIYRMDERDYTWQEQSSLSSLRDQFKALIPSENAVYALGLDSSTGNYHLYELKADHNKKEYKYEEINGDIPGTGVVYIVSQDGWDSAALLENNGTIRLLKDGGGIGSGCLPVASSNNGFAKLYVQNKTRGIVFTLQ
jgi:hypothetical protein